MNKIVYPGYKLVKCAECDAVFSVKSKRKYGTTINEGNDNYFFLQNLNSMFYMYLPLHYCTL